MKFPFLSAVIAVVFFNSPLAADSKKPIEEVTVFADAFFKDTTLVSPSSMITAEALKAINITTAEDALAHEPSLIVRKRFIGDPNGVIGLRSANMFQTPRSMVFVDGMPLHYHLQTRFRGAPRWSLVSPDEIEFAEVVYGPFSSEYSGNAMGGVVNFKTRRPQSQRITLEAGYFAQQYDQLNTDETYSGYRTYLAYENKFDDLGVSFSYTRLDNESQPQTQFFDQLDASPSNPSTATASSGFTAGVDEFGNNVIFFGDSGPEQAETDLFKTKLFYNVDNVELRASVAYEKRTRKQTQSNNFLLDVNDNLIFDRRVDINAEQLDTFGFGNSVFQNREQERESLLIGLGASFQISSDWKGDIFYSYFDVLNDEEIRTGANPDDPMFNAVNASDRARLTEYENTGWDILDIQFATDNLAGNNDQRLSVGLHIDSYKLNFIVDDFNSITGQRSANELNGDLSDGRGDSGGKARTLALFTQYGIAFNEQWDLSFGLRYDDWESKDGYIADRNNNAPPENIVTLVRKRSKSGFSPKLSLAFMPSDAQILRYSVARALRFPVVEELFVNNSDTSGGNISDPNLEPEDGIFHNLAFEQLFNQGSVKINLFYEKVDDVIFNQTTSGSNSITTFLPVGEVTTEGVELIVNVEDVLALPLDIRFNTTYTNAEITENINNPDFIGKDFPRIPEWRANLVLDYRLNENLGFGGSIRYASDTFGELDNSDTTDNVFGAQDAYTFVGIKTRWQATEQLELSTGIDNIFNEEAYVFHPWPGRTFHINAKFVTNK